jgi:arsenate reductase-like glutaredoxin family protein
MPTTVTIADDLADQLKPYQAQLAEILELGIREWQARGETGYNGLNSVLEQLAALPAPEEVLALRHTPPLLERLAALLEKNRTVGFSPDDQREWDKYEYVEHLVRLAKANAARKLKETGR